MIAGDNSCYQILLVFGQRNEPAWSGRGSKPGVNERVRTAGPSRDDDTLGRFNESVTRSRVRASAGDEIVIALDSDTSKANCGGGASDSKSTVLFEGEPAWHQDEAGQVGGLWDIHNTFLSASETLTEVHVRIVHTPSDTIIVDETYDDIVDGT